MKFSKNGKYKGETSLEAQETPINDSTYKSKETKMVIRELVEKNDNNSTLLSVMFVIRSLSPQFCQVVTFCGG